MTVADLQQDELGSEMVVAGFVACGTLRVYPDGSVWRLRKKVGGNQGPKLVDVEPTRADKLLPNGYRQVQVYWAGRRVVCSAHRLIWALHHGPLPEGAHIHHKNEVRDDNRLENLEVIDSSEHISGHLMGRVPWNKGTEYGKTSAFRKATATKADNYAARVRETVDLRRSGLSATEVARVLGLCTRQVHSRLRSRYAADHV